MASGNDDKQKVSMNMPVGALAAALVLGLASAAYALLMRENESTSREGMTSSASGMARSGKGMLRRAALTGLIAAIENDASRKVVIAVLKAMAKRS